MSENNIEVASCTVSELFSGKIDKNKNIKGELVIPEYQRPYVWAEKELEKLLSDIKEHNAQAQKPMYYLGSIILHKHGEKLSIIDGQQRLTTLAIIQQIKDRNVPDIKYSSPITIQHIKKNYEFLEKNYEFQKSGEENKKEYVEVDLEKLNVTLIVTNNEDDAYTFFETHNTAGVRLSGIDIIKAHHLRAISSGGKSDEHYAVIWEKQKNIELIVDLLIKARRWNALEWIHFPSYRDNKGRKDAIIKEFSEDMWNESEQGDYIQYTQIIAMKKNQYFFSPYKLAIRQPLINGENFIDYLEQFCELYQRLFKCGSYDENSKEYYKFNEKIIQNVDGTVFLKELYEISLLCYVNKFGTENLLEASFWIFRYTYSLRVSKSKTVREDSIPVFLRSNHYIFDIILSSFNHNQLIFSLKQFNYEFNDENTDGDTVKSRFIVRVAEYFGETFNKKDYDKSLTSAIDNKLKNEKKNG